VRINKGGKCLITLHNVKKENKKQIWKGVFLMAINELKDVEMIQSGESIDFVSGALHESELEGKTHYDLILKNVIQNELFSTKLQSGEPVQMKLTTIDGRTSQAEMEVRTVNSENPDNNIVEMVCTKKIEWS